MRIDTDAVAGIYIIGHIATFVYLTFFDGYVYTAWNWLYVVPINAFFGSIWPLYWGVAHWI